MSLQPLDFKKNYHHIINYLSNGTLRNTFSSTPNKVYKKEQEILSKFYLIPMISEKVEKLKKYIKKYNLNLQEIAKLFLTKEELYIYENRYVIKIKANGIFDKRNKDSIYPMNDNKTGGTGDIAFFDENKTGMIIT